MKTTLLLSLLVVLSACSQGAPAEQPSVNENTTSAIAGTEGVGGGDLCEDRIKTIRDDIKVWIKDGGHNNLDLPQSISADFYRNEMLDQIEKATVSCVAKGDAGYPVEVAGTPKVCKFSKGENSSKITCDLNKFKSLGDSEQYVLVHHELAGLAGLEKPNGDDSDYSISNQISGFLESQVIKKLVVGAKPSKDIFSPESCKGPKITTKDFLNILGKNNYIRLDGIYQVRVRNTLNGQFGPWNTGNQESDRAYLFNSGDLSSTDMNDILCNVIAGPCTSKLGGKVTVQFTTKCVRISTVTTQNNKQYQEVFYYKF